ncbi:IS4 family transposase [Streptococcus suis]|uniref:IS4 family transposase n=1 Tax=Streptococcus suis TaxID=1307 RepID=UPI000768E24D|nr:IS4 family transposase [Streptococcus suis]CYV65786.1 transposase [Streptococcus suis]
MLDQIKAHLLDSINDIVSIANQFVLHPEKDFSRKSQLTMETMIQAILTMGGNTLAKELLDLDLPVSQSAFVQRRYQLKHQAFKALFANITSKIPTFKDLPILAVDGSDVVLPRNRSDKTTTFQTGPHHTPYTLIHINALYNLEQEIYHDLRIQNNREVDERAAFIDMMESCPFEQALVIMDRGYESYNVMVHCQERNWSYIIRIRVGNHSMKSGFNLPDTPCFDEEFDLNICRKQTNVMKELYRDFPNQYHFLPHNASFDLLPNSSRKSDPISFYDLHFRMVRLEIKPGFFETLVTNTDYSPEKLKDLYAYRWGIETSFRDLKYSIGLTHFHAKKKEGILQEIYARFINFNVCKWLTSHVAIKPSKLKQAYKICFSDAVYACRKFLREELTSFQLETYIAKHLSIILPNRTFQRKIKSKAPVSFTYRIS